jgi:phosphotransferase system enzyme I (PtsI)
LRKTKDQILELETRMQEKLGDEHVAIFQAHQVVLEDPLFQEEVPDAISKRRLNAEHLVSEGLEKFKTLIATLEDPYFRERGVDIQDVGERLLKNLVGTDKDQLKKLDREVVVVAPDLAPSDTVTMPTDRVKGDCGPILGTTCGRGDADIGR